MSEKTGGPAFPSQLHLNANGMDLRDYFAAKVMQGFLSTSDTVLDYDLLARESYNAAAAMLKARAE